MPCSTHPVCLQVWYVTPRSSGLKTICLFRWNPFDFYWICLLLLLPCQMSNWSGWWMFGSSPKDVSTFTMKIFQTQRWQFVPLRKFQMWNLFMIMMTLKIRSMSNLSHAIKGPDIMHIRYEYKVYLKWLLIYGHLSFWLVIMEKLNVEP